MVEFGWIDYGVVGGTMLFSILIGVYYATCAKQQTQEDLLVGGRSMGIAPIAASMLVTYLSAITVLGYPAEVYAFGIQIFMNTIVFLIFVPLSVYFFMTVFYKMQLTSVYEYLELRFRSKFVRQFASFIFIIQMSFFMGVCLFAPSIALSSFIGLSLWQSVVGLGVCATIYTSIGGLKAVVWTDVFQLLMMMAGLLAIIVQGFIQSGGISETFRKASEHGRLQLLDFTIDPFMRHNALNFILGQGFTIFCLYGTHQPQVQRYSSLPSLKHAIHATIFAMPLNFFTVGLCLVAGIVIFSTYAGCDPFVLGHITRVDQIVPHFVKDKLGFIPGMMGLFVACVFSASLSTLSSGLNSVAAVVWEDFLVKIPSIKQMPSQNQAHIIRFIAVVFGILSIGLAFIAQHMGAILAATITALGAVNGPLGAIFFMGLLTPFVNRKGAICGMVSGFVIMVWITGGAFMLGKSHIPLAFNADECREPELMLSDPMLNSTASKLDAPEIEWPQKIYTLSYIMYPFVGGLITFVIAALVSILTGGCKEAKDVEERYLHPLLHSKKNKIPHTVRELRDLNYNSEKRVDRVASVEYHNPKSPSPSNSPTICYYDPLSTRDNLHSPTESVETPGFNSTEKPLLYRLPSSHR